MRVFGTLARDAEPRGGAGKALRKGAHGLAQQHQFAFEEGQQIVGQRLIIHRLSSPSMPDRNNASTKKKGLQE